MAVRIIPYEERCRDDMLFMILSAKDALGRVPSLNPDLLDIRGNYLDRGDGFWLALDENDRVVGSVGYSRCEDPREAFLHRLYVHPRHKREGIGSQLLATAEEAMRAAGVRVARVHLGEPRSQWFESWQFYPKHGYTLYAPRLMYKRLDGGDSRER